MSEPTPVVRLQGLKRDVLEAGQKKSVLRDINFNLRQGEWVSLMGASGSGKTTLLSVIGGLDGAFEGEVEVFGEALSGLKDQARTDLRNRLIGFVFQSFHLLEHLTVVENVEVPLWLSREPSTDSAQVRAFEALKKVGLAHRAHARVPGLSGGERQRVAIARALAPKPRLILADEPTGNLDENTGGTILELFEELRQQHDEETPTAVLVATHDPKVAARADRIVYLNNGILTEEP